MRDVYHVRDFGFRRLVRAFDEAVFDLFVDEEAKLQAPLGRTHEKETRFAREHYGPM